MSTTPYDAPYSTEAETETGSFLKTHPVITGVVSMGLIVAAAVAVGPRTVQVTVPQGTTIVAALTKSLSTEDAQIGQMVSLRAKAPVKLEDGTVIHSDLEIQGDVIHVKGGGRVAGAPELTLGFYTLKLGGTQYPIMTDVWSVRGRNDALKSTAEIGGGAVVGGVVGALTGNTVEGAVVGAALGTGVAVLTKGDQVVLPAGQRIRVRLAVPVTVRYQKKPSPTS